MTDWQETQAEDFCKSVRDGTHDSPKPVEEGRYLITSRHIIGDRIDLSNAYQIAQADFDEVNRRSKVDQWDVLITMIGTVGDVCLVREEPNFAIKNIGLFKTKGELSGKWLYYYMKSPFARTLLESLKRGTTQAYVPLGELRRFPIRYPKDVGLLEATVSLLSSFDDKIELNRRMNETLEAMARALFKDWFVDFGPTRAKMEGREPYLAQDIWDLFPDKLDDGGKPEGWEADVLGSFSNLQNGYAFKSKDWRDIGVPVVKIGSVKPAFVDLDQVSFVEDSLALERANFRLSIGDMLVGLTGYVGETGRIPPTKTPPMLNQRVGRFSPIPGVDPFVYSLVRQPEFKDFAESKSHGSAQANVSTKDLLTFPIPNPGEPIIAAFCKVADPLFRFSLANSGETSSLAETRDLLLPKLMSGEIRVAEAEKAVQEAR